MKKSLKKKFSLSFDNTEQAFEYKSDKALYKSYRLYSLMRYSALVKIGSFIAPLALKMKLPIKGIIRRTIFQLFCGGEHLEEVAKTASSLDKYGVKCVLDYGIEGSEGEANYDHSVKELQAAIAYAGTQSNLSMISMKITGFARFDLLEKMNKNSPLSLEEKNEWQRIIGRIDLICSTAYDNNISVLIDAEESWIQHPVDEIALQMMTKYNSDKITVYNTYQLYLKDRLSILKKHWQESIKNDFLLGVKVVRGAYMEKERNRAQSQGYPSPVQPDKEATDHDFNQAVLWCLERITQLALFIGTHNEESCMMAAKYLYDHNIPNNYSHVFFSQLYGMSDNITFNLAKSHYEVSKFLPYGPIEKVMPYLIRRSEENSSITDQMGREVLLLKKEIQRRKQKKA